MGRAAGLACGAVGVASGFASAFTDVPVGPVAEVTLASLAVVVMGFHLANYELRVFLGHWTIKELLRPLCAELVLGCAIPAGILIAIFNSRPSWALFVSVSLLLLFTYSIYEPVEETIQREVKRNHLPQGTFYFGSLKPLKFLGIDKDIATIAKDKHGPNLQSLLAFFVGKPWLGGLSRTRTVILCALLIGFGAAAAAAADVWVQETVRPAKTSPFEKEEQPAPEASAAPLSETAEISAEGGESPREAGECSTLPGDGAPAWAKKELNALYLGHRDFEATPPPGFEVGGCTGGAIVRDQGEFVYAVGKSPTGEILSVAVNSHRLGPAIFLAPAAQVVLAMIEADRGPIGGYPRLNVAGGDVAPVLTPSGTVILIRTAKHPPGMPRYAIPYVELPATVATAWMGAMKELDLWLWPIKPVHENGSVLFPLLGETETGSLKLGVLYDAATNTARRGPYSYDLPQDQLNPTELKDHAEEAPYYKPQG